MPYCRSQVGCHFAVIGSTSESKILPNSSNRSGTRAVIEEGTGRAHPSDTGWRPVTA